MQLGDQVARRLLRDATQAGRVAGRVHQHVMGSDALATRLDLRLQGDQHEGVRVDTRLAAAVRQPRRARGRFAPRPWSEVEVRRSSRLRGEGPGARALRGSRRADSRPAKAAHGNRSSWAPRRRGALRAGRGRPAAAPSPTTPISGHSRGPARAPRPSTPLRNASQSHMEMFY